MTRGSHKYINGKRNRWEMVVATHYTEYGAKSYGCICVGSGANARSKTSKKTNNVTNMMKMPREKAKRTS